MADSSEIPWNLHPELPRAPSYPLTCQNLFHFHDLDVLFMSDWSGARATYIVMDDSNNLELKTFDIDETVS